MINDPVPLQRHFSLLQDPQTDSDEQELRSIWSGRDRTGWRELEEEHRCVILAEAGAGKTHEMKARAELAEEHGRTAFFIRIEDIREGLENALEVGSADALDRWLHSSEEAWFFLDSVDEARLDSPRNFEKAITRFAKRIKSAQHRARVFISSRPYAWRARSDRYLIEWHLPFRKPARTGPDEHGGRVGENDADDPSEQESALRVYKLDPLDEGDIRKFAEHRDTPETDRLITELHRANLMPIATRPFDLEAILLKWKADRVLEGRHELLAYIIDLRLREIHPDRKRRQPLNPEKARRGAGLLAAAVILTGKRGIRVPDSPLDEDGVDAADVLGEDWPQEDVQALLERGLFDEALYGAVRFRHREVRELLAAEWFHAILNEGGSRYATESLFFREQYGHAVIVPRLRPVLCWLIILDANIRRRALEISPEIAIEGGDAARLPPSERQAILHGIVRRIVDDVDNRSARDYGAIARIAQPDLTDDTRRLIDEHRENDEAIYFLSLFVWQGGMEKCVPALSEFAGDPSREVFARKAAAYAVMTCGNRDQRNRLWVQLIASREALPRRLLAEVVEVADPDMVSVNLVLASLDSLEAHNRYEATGLRLALHDFIRRLPAGNPNCAQEPLTALVAGLHEHLVRRPYIEQAECQLSAKFAWLLGPAAHAVERLVSVQSAAALSPEALAVMETVPVARLWDVEDYYEHQGRLDELVPAWDELNDALFWRSVEQARDRLKANSSERLTYDLQVHYVGHYWDFGIERFGDVLKFIGDRAFQDDKLVALSLALRLFMKADEPACWLSELEQAVKGNKELTERLNAHLNPREDQALRELEEEAARRTERRKKEKEEYCRQRAEWIKHLKSVPELVRHPPDLEPGQLSDDQCRLLVEIKRADLTTSLADGANWEALIPDFGEDVARAYRDAAIAHWRKFRPGLRSEGHDSNEIPVSLSFAMSGLEIEANEISEFPANLNDDQVRHALRYIFWEINGFPGWLERLHRTRPDLVLDAILKELKWELANAGLEQRVNYNLCHHAPWIHETLIPAMCKFMEENEIPNPDALRHCIDILLSGGTERQTAMRLARSNVASGATTEQSVLWHALWISVDAEHGIQATGKWLSGLRESEASRAAQLLIVRLMGTRRPLGTGHGHRDFRNAHDLKSLYVLMLQHVRVEDNMVRAGTGECSPGLRDHAQDACSALFHMLCEIPGKVTYVALNELAADHPDPRHRSHLKKLSYRQAEGDADPGPWSARQVRELDRQQAITPATHRQLFDLAVGRLNDLKHWVECGNDSTYKTWQRVPDEGEMRNLVAAWLNQNSSGHCTYVQEPELANSQRPDIWMQTPQVASPVPIELKILDKNWSGPKLCERMRNQLAGDYLREQTAGCGVFLLVWQGQSNKRRWTVDGRRVSLSDLPSALAEHWKAVSDTFPGVDKIEVILIDLTVRDRSSASKSRTV